VPRFYARYSSDAQREASIGINCAVAGAAVSRVWSMARILLPIRAFLAPTFCGRATNGCWSLRADGLMC